MLLTVWQHAFFPCAFALWLKAMEDGEVCSDGDLDDGRIAPDLEHMRHDGFLFLQPPRSHPHRLDVKLNAHWWLIHSVTHERVKLQPPQGTWELCIDNDGFATLYDSVAKVELDCCDLLTKHLVSSNQRTHIMEKGRGVVMLSERQLKYKEVELKVAVGPTRATHSIPGFVVLHALQHGMRFCWSCILLYKVLCLRVYKGVASKWSYEMWEAWAGYMKEFGLHGQLIQSTRHGLILDEIFTDGYAPFPAMSTLALLHMLCRWTACPPKRGGMRVAINRDAALVLFASLVKEAIGPRPVFIEIDAGLFKDTQSKWPLKPCNPNLVLGIQHATVDLAPWRECVSAPLRCPEGLLTWWEKCDLEAHGSSISLVSLLKRSIEECPDLFCQLLTQTACRVEEGIFLALTPTKGFVAPPIGCKYCTILDTMDNPDTLNAHLLRHVYSGVEASRRFGNVSLTSDKASVCGLSLDAGCIGTPDNLVSVAVPQAFVFNVDVLFFFCFVVDGMVDWWTG